MKNGLVTRNKKVAFMECKMGESSGKYYRMSKFTEMSTEYNPNEYSRKYVDETGETTDVTGYSPSTSYAFDFYVENPVHKEIIDITENEKVGDDAIRNVITVDFSQEELSKDPQGAQYKATMRPYSVVPDGSGDDENTMTYTGSLKSKGEKKEVFVKSTDNWATLEIVERA